MPDWIIQNIVQGNIKMPCAPDSAISAAMPAFAPSCIVFVIPYKRTSAVQTGDFFQEDGEFANWAKICQ